MITKAKIESLKSARPGRFLVVKFGSLGDIVHCLPSVAQLRRADLQPAQVDERSGSSLDKPVDFRPAERSPQLRDRWQAMNDIAQRSKFHNKEPSCLALFKLSIFAFVIICSLAAPYRACISQPLIFSLAAPSPESFQ